MNPFAIRTAGSSDAEALVKYLAELRAERLPTILRYPTTPTIEEEAAFMRRFEREGADYFVAEVDGRIVGNLSIFRHVHPQTAHSASLGMAVLAPYRSRGVGSCLLDAAISWSERRKICRVELEVLSNNEQAQRLYARKGFIVEGRRRGAVEVDGSFVDAILMARVPEGGS